MPDTEPRFDRFLLPVLRIDPAEPFEVVIMVAPPCRKLLNDPVLRNDERRASFDRVDIWRRPEEFMFIPSTSGEKSFNIATW